MAENPNHVEIKNLIEGAKDADGEVDRQKAADGLRAAGYGKLADQIAKG